MLLLSLALNLGSRLKKLARREMMSRKRSLTPKIFGLEDMADIIFLILLALHIGAIVGWMGGAVLFISVVAPSLRRMSPPTRAEFVISTIPAYVRFILGTSVTAVVAGVLLLGYITSMEPSLAPSGSGMVLIQGGALIGLIVLIVAFGLILPTGRKLVSVAKQMKQGTDAQQSPSVEVPQQIGRLQKRLSMGGGIGAALLAVALILMIIGTNI